MNAPHLKLVHAEPDLAPLLEGSLELLAAIEAIDVTEGHEWQGECSCHRKLSECAEVYDGNCSLECCALELLWNWHPQQDQSPAMVARVVGMIEASFARAAAKERA